MKKYVLLSLLGFFVIANVHAEEDSLVTMPTKDKAVSYPIEFIRRPLVLPQAQVEAFVRPEFDLLKLDTDINIIKSFTNFNQYIGVNVGILQNVQVGAQLQVLRSIPTLINIDSEQIENELSAFKNPSLNALVGITVPGLNLADIHLGLGGNYEFASDAEVKAKIMNQSLKEKISLPDNKVLFVKSKVVPHELPFAFMMDASYSLLNALEFFSFPMEDVEIRAIELMPAVQYQVNPLLAASVAYSFIMAKNNEKEFKATEDMGFLQPKISLNLMRAIDVVASGKFLISKEEVVQSYNIFSLGLNYRF